MADDRTFEVVVRITLEPTICDGAPSKLADAKEVVLRMLESAQEDCQFWNGVGLQPECYRVDYPPTVKYVTEVVG